VHFAVGAGDADTSAVRRVLSILIAALACDLSACSGGSDQAAAPAAAQDPETGAKLYRQNCVPCHREDGKGVPGLYPSLAQSPVANGNATELVRWVLAGQRPASMPAGRYSTQMVQFGWMKDPDAAALLSYVRSNFGNSSPPLEAATVAAARP
jgi:mono/diheme cytochrome c family protein